MKINNIHIQNFKGIEDKIYRFNPQFTVLIGDNGSGKSSILDAIAIAIGTILLKTNTPFGINGQKSRPLLDNEVRKVMMSSENIEYMSVKLAGEFSYKEQILEWERTKTRSAKSLLRREAKELVELGKQFIENVDKPFNLPVFAYYSTSRSIGSTPRKISYQRLDSRLSGYAYCLDTKSANLSFKSWFKTFEDNALKFNKDKTLYNAFSEALSLMVNDWTQIHYHWGLDDIIGLREDGSWLPMRDLSDGYKGILKLAADIAYRSIKLNPHLGAKAVEETEGIVLIDELDIHLHPKWQQKIIADLKNTFPKIQFITTTHSPFIVQSLKANEILNLDAQQIDQHPDSMTLEENALFMGIRNKHSLSFNHKEKLAIDYLQLLNNKDNGKGLEKLETLIDLTQDPVLKAKLKLEKLSKFGKK